eukprot:TRINITY_DN109242_c0_g1_i1.p1 TRINITY_DN109242_c0_g1~~TRINITY_DN109242_c0_g1_i1.p1  ORF type:complete len:256 (+),score=27.92 TRINITY_DN109242_c0_g1_i1:527-1294(+)
MTTGQVIDGSGLTSIQESAATATAIEPSVRSLNQGADTNIKPVTTTSSHGGEVSMTEFESKVVAEKSVTQNLTDASANSSVTNGTSTDESSQQQDQFETYVHRYYGNIPGTVFTIRTQELYFTQDSCAKHFKDSNHTGQPKLTIHDSFNALLTHEVRQRDIEMIEVVFREGYYYSVNNRRLAMYLLLNLCGACPRLKVRLVSEDAPHVRWGKRFTTTCDGMWIVIRQTGEVVGRNFEDTTFKHCEIDKARLLFKE